MDCFRRICCCSTADTRYSRNENQPLVEHQNPPIPMDDVGIQVSEGMRYGLCLSDLDIHEVHISYNTTQGWLLVELSQGRQQAAHSLKKNESESNSAFQAYSMQYGKDGRLLTITVKIPTDVHNDVTGHSYTEVSLNSI